MEQRPPIYRLMEWISHRKSLCMECKKQPKQEGWDYCSEECEEEFFHTWVHG